jgi:hypothetical protein
MNTMKETSETGYEWENWIILQIKRLLSWLGIDFLVQGTLLLVLYSSMIFGLTEMIPQVEPSLLARPLFTGLLVGWLLGRSSLPGKVAFVFMMGCGIILTLVFVGDLGPSLLRIPWELNAHAMVNQILPVSFEPTQSTLAGTALADLRRDLAPLLLAELDLWGGVRALAIRGAAWITSLLQRETGFDPQISSLVWSFLLWCLAVWSSWAVRRNNSPLLAVLPAGVVLSVSLAYTGKTTVPLLVFLGASLMLIAWNSFSRRLRGWEAQGVDYAEDLRLDVNLTALLLSIAFVCLAAITALLSIEKIERFVDSFRPKSSEVNRAVAEPLGLSPRTAPAPPEERKARTSMGAAGMPRQHLLGSGPELSNELVMYISTGDLPRLPFELAGNFTVRRYYWRALTYNRYTGNGWASSAAQPDQATNTRIHPSGEAVYPGFILFPEEGRRQIFHPAYLRPGIRIMQQAVRQAVDLNGLVYVSGDLLGLNLRYRTLWRIPPDLSSGITGDLYAAEKFGVDKTYRAWSALIEPGESLLRSAGEEYPDWIQQYHLALPDDLPQRVRDLAQSLTAQDSTPYDRAVAIEAYLRQFPYTLDLPAPPAGRDVVDYFLFDLQRGYCDYYASAMVVLARAAGIPARLAIGYAGGNYNPEQAAYQISEANGHSWPELYFAGFGWVAFEPTAGLPLIERPDQVSPAAGEPVVPGLAEPEKPDSWAQRLSEPLEWLRLISYVIVGSVIIVLIWFISEPFRINRMEPALAIFSIYKRLYRWAERAGYAHGKGDTPNEFADRLSDHLEKSLARARWKQQVRMAMSPANTRKVILQLAGLYSRSQYSSHPLTPEERWEAVRSWGRLRWWLWLSQRL